MVRYTEVINDHVQDQLTLQDNHDGTQDLTLNHLYIKQLFSEAVLRNLELQ